MVNPNVRPTGARVEQTDWGAKSGRNNSWPLKERACRPLCVTGNSDSLTAGACSLLSVFASKFGETGRPRFHLLPLSKAAPAFLVALACWDETSESSRQNAHDTSSLTLPWQWPDIFWLFFNLEGAVAPVR